MLALEASIVAQRLYWHLKGRGPYVRRAHPLEVRRMAVSKKKSDAIDSFELADLLWMNRLPEAHIPPPELNERRQLRRYRIDLRKMMRRIKWQILALLDQFGVTTELTDFFGISGRLEMRRVTARLPTSQRLNRPPWRGQGDKHPEDAVGLGTAGGRPATVFRSCLPRGIGHPIGVTLPS